MSDNIKKVAVVGLGYFSQFHLRAWSQHPHARLVTATDLDKSARSKAALDFEIAVVETLDRVLDHDPDIIDIVAPPIAHAEIIRASFSAGRVIICQKPFCTSLEEARLVAEQAAAADTQIIIHENFRFQPWYRTIRKLIEAGDVGDIYNAHFALRPGDGRGPEAYLSRQPSFQKMPRLLIHETGVHFIDLFSWLLGDVTAIYADLRKLNPVIAGEDAGILVMDHANGAQSTFDGNRLLDHLSDQPRRTMGEMCIEGTKGTVNLTGAGQVFWRAFGSREQTEIPVDGIDSDSFGGGCVSYLINHVMDAIGKNVPFENTIKDYLRIIELSDLAYASDQSGKKLSVTRD